LTEPNYFVLASIVLVPALYFVLAGLLVPGRGVDWWSVGLGLVPGIGLAACAGDAHKLVRSTYAAWRKARIGRRANPRVAHHRRTISAAQTRVANENHFAALRRAA
jgi:hypothetical protein